MSNLTRYNQNQGDRAAAGHDESMFGHYVEEQGWTVKEALENLAPLCKQTYAETVAVSGAAKWIGVGATLAGILGAGTLGAIGALPLGAAFLAFQMFRENSQCIPRRATELRALKNCPNLLELMYGCHLRGAETRNLIAAWDLFLDGYAECGEVDANVLAREYLRILDQLSFTMPSSDGAATQPLTLPSVSNEPSYQSPTIDSQTRLGPVNPQAIQSGQSCYGNDGSNAGAIIGQNTRLNAIETPAVTQPSRPKDALSALLASPYVSRAFFGAQRTGKSYLAAVASYELAKRGTKVYHLNLASYGSEDAVYWQHATQTMRGDLASIDVENARAIVRDAIALVKDFFNQDDALLIVDEVAYIGSKSGAHAALLEPLMKIIADKITALESTGIKRKKAIWTIAPSFVASSLSDHCKAVKKLQLTYVTIPPGHFVNWEGSAIGFSTELYEQIRNNFTITMPSVATTPPGDRICFINNQWVTVGELPSLPKLVSVVAPQSITSTPIAHDENIVLPINEIAAARGIDRPTIAPDEPEDLAIESTSDFDRLMKWFETHPDSTPTIAELTGVHKFKASGKVPLENLLEAAVQMQILSRDSSGKANRYSWSGEF